MHGGENMATWQRGNDFAENSGRVVEWQSVVRAAQQILLDGSCSFPPWRLFRLPAPPITTAVEAGRAFPRCLSTTLFSCHRVDASLPPAAPAQPKARCAETGKSCVQ